MQWEVLKGIPHVHERCSAVLMLLLHCHTKKSVATNKAFFSNSRDSMLDRVGILHAVPQELPQYHFLHWALNLEFQKNTEVTGG